MKKIVVFVVLLAIVSLAAFGNVEAKSKSPIELSLQILWPSSGSIATYCYKPWIEAVEKATDGRVKIELYELSGLVPVDQVLEGARSGAVDMIEVTTPRLAGRMALWEIFTVMDPTRPPENEAPYSTITWELYKRASNVMHEKIEDMKVLFCWTSGPIVFFSTKKKVPTLDSGKGIKIWAVGLSAIAYKAAGWVPTSLGEADMFTGMQRGVVDMLGTSYPAAEDHNIYSLSKYCLKMSGPFAIWPVMMTKEKWNSLPKDIQDAIESVSGAYAANIFDKGYKEASEAVQAKWPKVEYYNWSDADLKEFYKRLEVQRQAWFAHCERNGYSKDSYMTVFNTMKEVEADFYR